MEIKVKQQQLYCHGTLDTVALFFTVYVGFLDQIFPQKNHYFYVPHLLDS